MSRANAAVRRRRRAAHATSRRRGAARSAAPGRATPRRGRLRQDAPRFYAVTLLIMFYGSAVAVLLVAAGWAALLTEGINQGGTAERVVADGAEQEEGLGAPADISIDAEHLGDLRVSIEARVTMNAPKDPLGGAKVEAYLDMVQMSGAHTQGPLELPEERPGVYATTATVPMLGDYEVRVQMNDPGLPVHAEATEVVSVGVVGSDQ